MRLGSISVALGFLLACTAPAHTASEQQASGSKELQQQVNELREQVTAMQKDLDEIKALLAPLRARQSPQVPANLLIDPGGRPVKGERTAKLTLVEVTDYQ
ncbi:MAG: hypothetical protein EHM13_08755 [Acidobacteria bacterium]|nr:MAG: hypothetical protein EHM13_08755 [Acidobacteriota bacterium]